MQICDQGAIKLLAGVVKRTTKDWKNAQRSLRKRPNSKNAVQHERTISECERFFRSAHFARMTGINGEAFLKRLMEKEGLP